MRIHIVQKGDTLWTIAKKYGVDFEELKKMNAQLSNPEMVMPGMKIKVPGGGAAAKHDAHHHKPHVEHKEMPHHKPHVEHKEMPHHKPHVEHKEMPHHKPHVEHKEMPHKPHIVKKEMPKVEHPFVQHKEIPKAVVIPPKEVKKKMEKEKPHYIYQPVMPQLPPQMPPSLPEIDINNYYMMNMSQQQAQIQQQPQPEVKQEYHEEPAPMPPPMPVQMPIMEAPCPPPMHYNYCYPAPQLMPFCDPCYPAPHVMPVCDPCYPYHQPHHMNMYPQQWMPPVQMQQGPMPAVLPGMMEAPYPTFAPHWEEESSSHPGHYGPMAGEAAMPMPQMPYQPYQGVMPSFQAPYQSPAVAYQKPIGDCGCGRSQYGGYPSPPQYMGPSFQQMPQTPLPYSYGPMMPEGAGTYAMPSRYDVEEDDE